MLLFLAALAALGQASPGDAVRASLEPFVASGELAGAVACAQFHKVEKVVEARVRGANLMTSLIAGLDGVYAPKLTEGTTKHVYWKYCLRVDAKQITGGVDAFARALKERGIFSAPRYIQKPAFACEVFRDQVTFGKSGKDGYAQTVDPGIAKFDVSRLDEALKTIVVFE